MMASGYKSAGIAAICIALCACSGTKRLEIDDNFPVPLMDKAPVNLGIHLDEDLTGYTHTETIEKKGTWEVSIGPAQQKLFDNLASGVFEGYAFVNDTAIIGTATENTLDGVLKPTIKEVQFSLPVQTRSNYYEVWIRYEFQLYDKAGTLIGDWNLPAYGKASKKNYGSSSRGLQAAAMAACRDAMAFFSINFSREPVVRKWLTAGKPQQPAPPPTQTAPAPDPQPATNPAPAAKEDQA